MGEPGDGELGNGVTWEDWAIGEDTGAPLFILGALLLLLLLLFLLLPPLPKPWRLELRTPRVS